MIAVAMRSRFGRHIGAVLLIMLMIGCSKSPSASDTGGDAKSTATVTTAALRSGQLSQTITAYGSVTAEPGAVTVLSLPIECHIVHLPVTAGESVDAQAVVIEVEPSPDTRLQLIDARNALQGAKNSLASARERFALKLATTTELQTAEQAERSAQAKLDDLIARGAGESHHVLKMSAAGIIQKIDVQEGQLVPAGAPLVEIVPRGQIEVRLGIATGDATLIRPNQTVELFPMMAGEDEEPINARVRLVTQHVSPDSRLVDVFATLTETRQLLLNQPVRAEVSVRTVSGLVVPHEALLVGDGGYTIFTVQDGKAFKHTVTVALQNDKEAVITGAGLHEGDPVVTAGALELDDGVAVNGSAPTTAPAAGEEK